MKNLERKKRKKTKKLESPRFVFFILHSAFCVLHSVSQNLTFETIPAGRGKRAKRRRERGVKVSRFCKPARCSYLSRPLSRSLTRPPSPRRGEGLRPLRGLFIASPAFLTEMRASVEPAALAPPATCLRRPAPRRHFGCRDVSCRAGRSRYPAHAPSRFRTLEGEAGS